MLKLIHSERNNQKINLSNQGGYIATFYSFWLIRERKERKKLFERYRRIQNPFCENDQ